MKQLNFAAAVLACAWRPVIEDSGPEIDTIDDLEPAEIRCDRTQLVLLDPDQVDGASTSSGWPVDTSQLSPV